MQLKRFFAVLFFVLLGILLALTYYPDLPDVKIRIRDEWFRLDYIGHFGFYAAIAVSFLIWRAGWRKKVPEILILYTVLGSVVLGIATEFSQFAIPGRSFNPIDMSCNLLGIVVGVAAVYALSRTGKSITI